MHAKVILKWLGIVLLALVVLGAAGGGFIWWKSSALLRATYEVPAGTIAIPTGDAAALERGRHLVDAVGKCQECHGEGFRGTVFIDALPFARVGAPNLTSGRGGVAVARSDADLVRAIRHGVAPDGRGLVIMPSEAYIHFTDADLGAIVAYLRTLPAVDNELPATVVGPIARALLVAGKLPVFPAAYIAHDSVAPYATAPDTTAAYGRYLAWTGACHVCHTPSLSGGAAAGPPGSPIAANITPGGLPDWTLEEFRTLLREGRGRGGREINNEFMPWRPAGHMTDAEIHAVYLYLRSVPARELGQP